jgi:acetyltransferase
LTDPLAAIFEARSVAVVGASADSRKRGHQVVRSLLGSAYEGDILPVHPDGGTLLGLPVARSVTDLPCCPDLALVCTRAASVPGVLERCAGRGVKGAVILAVGFDESGPEGEALAREVGAIADRTGLRVIGPNTSGFMNPGLGLNLVGIRAVEVGRMALLSQSGNVALDIITRASAGSVGISLYVGIGNELDVRFHEYISYLETHRASEVILIYAEGFRDGRAFMHAVSRVGRKKPIVVLKGGRSANGASAARSHTGAIAGSYEVFRSLLEQVGAHEVTRSDELLRVGEMLAGQPPFRSGGVVVLADGGGHATLATDALESLEVPLAKLTPATRTRLAELLHSAAAVSNPIDLAGAADRAPAVFARVFQELRRDPECAGVVITGLLGGYALRFTEELEAEETAAAAEIGRLAREASLPTVVHTVYAESGTRALAELHAAGIPVVDSLELACRCAAAAHARRRFMERDASSDSLADVAAEHVGICATSRVSGDAPGTLALTELEARRLLAGQNVPMAPHVVVRTELECERAVAALGGPAVLKVLSATIPHKTEAGGVALDVAREDAADTFRRIVRAGKAFADERDFDAGIEGVLVSPMLPHPALELIVGARCDPNYGPVVLVGAGGTSVELLRDVAIRALPVDGPTAAGMLDDLQIASLFDGFRGSVAIDRGPLVDIILGVARCALENPQISEVEVNPVLVYEGHSVAVDARVFVRDTGPETE